MLAVAQGDMNAFGVLVHRHQQAAWSVAYRFLGDRTEAEDVAQDAFLRILEAAPRYKPTASFQGYLYRIVARLCLDRVRKHRPMHVAEVPHPTATEPDASARMASQERDAAVAAALAGLPPNQRMAVVLRYFEGLNLQDIAAMMDTTVKSVERLLARGREALAPLLADLAEK